MTRRLSKSEWSAHIKKCNESGSKVIDYCRAHGLSAKTMSYWRSTLKKEEPRYVPVVSVEKSPTSPLEVTHSKSGITISIPIESSKTILPHVLEALSCLS